MSCLGTSPIAGATGGSSAANETETKASENAGKRFRVVAPCYNGPTRDFPRINAGQEKELPVPQRDDRGVELTRPANIVGRIGDDGRRLDDEFDVVGKNGT
jgi:hypothetical protein